MYDKFKCNLCKNSIKDLKICLTCQTNYCQICISNHLHLKNVCPSCYAKNPNFSDIPRNLKILLDKFKITCKNKVQGC